MEQNLFVYAVQNIILVPSVISDKKVFTYSAVYTDISTIDTRVSCCWKTTCYLGCESLIRNSKNVVLKQRWTENKHAGNK